MVNCSFRKREKKNFTMFNYVNDMNAEKGNIKINIDNIMANIKTMTRSTISRHWDSKVKISEVRNST